MKRRSVHRAYESVRPDAEAKDRMLKNILLSSEIPPAGKDERLMRKNMKPLIIAAMIGLMVILMGCAVVVMRLQEMKIGEFSYSEDAYIDDSGNLVEPTETVRDVLSLQGFSNSPGMLAAKEWLEFEESYEVDGQMIGDAEAAGYVAPREYDAYFVFDQTMQNKVDEIAAKYGLKLAGRAAMVQSYQSELLFDALGLENVHHEDEALHVEYGSGYFFECGNFNLNFWMKLPEDLSRWPYEILTSMRYCDKEYLDTVHFTVDDIESVQQWNYTTTDGTEILIAMGGKQACYFCNRENAFISVSFWTDYEYESGEISYMSREDVELLANFIDFSIVPQKPDMDAAVAALEKSERDAMEKKEYFGYDDFIQDRIEKLGGRAEELYYYMIDLTGDDGEDELILGSKDEIDIVWTMIDGEMNMIMDWGENYQKLEEAWPTMEKKPITEYFEESEQRDKYGYQSYIMELLSMEHPENSLFVLADINSDGTLELLIGDKEQLSFVWRVKYYENGNSSIELLSWSMTKEELSELKTAWPDMERKPVTEYFSE